MEGIDAIMQLINTAGFPMAMCIVLMMYVKKQAEESRATTEKFMITLSEYNQNLATLAEKINRLFGEDKR